MSLSDHTALPSTREQELEAEVERLRAARNRCWLDPEQLLTDDAVSAAQIAWLDCEAGGDSRQRRMDTAIRAAIAAALKAGDSNDLA